MSGVSVILDRWPNGAEVARDLGLSYDTVRAWRTRGVIPVMYWRRVVDAARVRGLPGVTLDALLDAYTQKYAPHPASPAAAPVAPPPHR